MGWTSTYEPNKKKAEEIMLSEFEGTSNAGKYSILSKAKCGSTYYLAIETVGEEGREVYCRVVLTSRKGSEFYWKDLSETSEPVEQDCPLGILNRLTPTTNATVNSWRAMCRHRAETRAKVRNCECGSILVWDGKEQARKMPPNYQFKKEWFLSLGKSNRYITKESIPYRKTITILPPS